jgi:ATP-dependent Clp protease ATP-binding subunit ClpA
LAESSARGRIETASQADQPQQTGRRQESLRSPTSKPGWVLIRRAVFVIFVPLTVILVLTVAAKQEAFEEAAKLKNQFRALDDDEIDFLDSINESSRAKENAVRQETAAQLEAFRKQRAAAEQTQLNGIEVEENLMGGSQRAGNLWATRKKKRRRDFETLPIGDSKVPRLSSRKEIPPPVPQSAALNPGKIASATTAIDTSLGPQQCEQEQDKGREPNLATKRHEKLDHVKLGLGGYSSDEDD